MFRTLFSLSSESHSSLSPTTCCPAGFFHLLTSLKCAEVPCTLVALVSLAFKHLEKVPLSDFLAVDLLFCSFTFRKARHLEEIGQNWCMWRKASWHWEPWLSSLLPHYIKDCFVHNAKFYSTFIIYLVYVWWINMIFTTHQCDAIVRTSIDCGLLEEWSEGLPLKNTPR
jgi:hypothetical protein